MFVIDNLSSETLDKTISKYVEKDTLIVTDSSSSYVNFKEYFAISNMLTILSRRFFGVHVVIERCSESTAIHDEMNKQFLQLFLNEFC